MKFRVIASVLALGLIVTARPLTKELYEDVLDAEIKPLNSPVPFIDFSNTYQHIPGENIKFTNGIVTDNDNSKKTKDANAETNLDNENKDGVLERRSRRKRPGRAKVRRNSNDGNSLYLLKKEKFLSNLRKRPGRAKRASKELEEAKENFLNNLRKRPGRAKRVSKELVEEEEKDIPHYKVLLKNRKRPGRAKRMDLSDMYFIHELRKEPIKV